MQQRQHWQDAFDAQMGIWRWLGTEHGVSYLLMKYEQEILGDGSVPDGMREIIAYISAGERRKMRSATPYFVSAEMCEVVEAAKESFEPEPVLPTDFFTLSGFLYFERPFVIADRTGREIRLAGFSWMPMVTDDVKETGIEDAEGSLEQLAEHHRMVKQNHAVGDGMALCLYAVPLKKYGPDPQSPLLPMHFTPWWFDMSFEGNEVDAAGQPTGVGNWWRIVQTTLRLMQQKLAVHHHQRPTRPQRREAQREGHTGSDIVVIRLRREKAETPNGHVPTPANYSHRFFVGLATGGFWRPQHYRSLGPARLPDGTMDPKTHRQIWIAPFQKGDDSLPLLIKPRRVYTWDR